MYNNINHNELFQNLLSAHYNLRSGPYSYIEKIEKNLKYLKENTLSKPLEYSIQTIEGRESYLEAIEFLKEQKSLPKLILDERLSKSAEDRIKD